MLSRVAASVACGTWLTGLEGSDSPSLGMKPVRQVRAQCWAGESHVVREGAKGIQGTYSVDLLTPNFEPQPVLDSQRDYF